MFFIVCYSCFFCLLQLDVSQFLVKFHKLQGIEPKVGVANVYVNMERVVTLQTARQSRQHYHQLQIVFRTCHK